MGKGFWALFKKDCRMLSSGKFFLMAIVFLALYTAYVNRGYIRFMQMEPYNVYLYDPAGTQTEKSPLVQTVSSMEAMDAALLSDANSVRLDVGTFGQPRPGGARHKHSGTKSQERDYLRTAVL